MDRSKFTGPTQFRQNIKQKYNLPEKKIDETLITRMFYLLDEGNIEKIKQFIHGNRMLLNVKNTDGDGPIHIILKSANMIDDDKIILVKYFLLNGASPTLYNKFNITPLHIAVQKQIPEIVDLLLKYKADINAQDSNNMIPLHYAIIGDTSPCPVQKDVINTDISKKNKLQKNNDIIKMLINETSKFILQHQPTKMYFENIFNNIGNYDELYKNEINTNKQTLYKKINEIIDNIDIDMNEKQQLITTEITNMMNNIKSIFTKDIFNAMNDMTDYYLYNDNAIEFNTSKMPDEMIYKHTHKTINDTLTDMNKIILDMEKILTDSTSGSTILISNLCNYLKDVRWINRNLEIKYKWIPLPQKITDSGSEFVYFEVLEFYDSTNGTTPYGKYIAIDPSTNTPNMFYKERINVPVNHEQLDELYKYTNLTYNINPILIKDINMDIITTYTNVLNYARDISINELYADKYNDNNKPPPRTTLPVLHYNNNNNYHHKFNTLKIKMPIDDWNRKLSSLGFTPQEITEIETHMNGASYANREYFDTLYTNDTNNILSSFINNVLSYDTYIIYNVSYKHRMIKPISDNAVITFFKPIYIINILIKKLIQNVIYNIQLLGTYLDKDETWYSMMHIIPSIMIEITILIHLLKSFDIEYTTHKNKFTQIQKLFLDKKNNDNVKNNNDNKLYDIAIDKLNEANSQMEQLHDNYRRFFILIKTLSDKYNFILDQISDLHGYYHMKSYYNNFQGNNITNDQYNIGYNFFDTPFDNFKLNLKNYKTITDIESVDTDRLFDIFLNPMFSYNGTYYIERASINTILDILKNNNYIIKYPHYGIDTEVGETYIFPENLDGNLSTVRDKQTFLQLQKYAPNTGQAHPYLRDKFKFINIQVENPYEEYKKNTNKTVIKGIIGNHYLFIKYYLIHYVVNYILTQNDLLTRDILAKLLEYKNKYINELNLNNQINEFKTNHIKLLVKIVNQMLNNHLKYYITEKARLISYNILASNQIIPETTLYLFKPDQYISETKLLPTINEVLSHVNYPLYDTIMHDEIFKEIDEKLDIFKSTDGTCYKIKPQIIEMLVNNGSNIGQIDNLGKYPISYAIDSKNLSIIKLMTQLNGIEYYKNSKQITNYFNTIFLETIHEIVNNASYNKFYERYKNKLIKKLESKPEINTNILSSIELTIPMLMSLLNSMLFYSIINYKYGWTKEKTDELMKIIATTRNNRGQGKYVGPILYQILSSKKLTIEMNNLQQTTLMKEINKIETKIEYLKNSSRELNNDKQLYGQPMPNTPIYDKFRINQLDTAITQSAKELNYETSKINTINTNKDIPHNIVINTTDIKKNIDSVFVSLKSISSTYNGIFRDVMNNNPNDYSNIFLYKSLWKNYTNNLNHSDFITNIHLVSLEHLELNVKNNVPTHETVLNVLKTFNEIARDYMELPNEYNDNVNYYLTETINLITHTITHTIFIYLFATIIKMIIKQLNESNFEQYNLKEMVDKFMLNSHLYEYIFSEMPRKYVKITLKIFDGDDDPDHLLTEDKLFSELQNKILIGATGIINIGDNFTKNLNGFVIPYYKEYISVVSNELLLFSNNFYNHLNGIYQMSEIYKNFN